VWQKLPSLHTSTTSLRLRRTQRTELKHLWGLVDNGCGLYGNMTLTLAISSWHRLYSGGFPMMAMLCWHCDGIGMQACAWLGPSTWAWIRTWAWTCRRAAWRRKFTNSHLHSCEQTSSIGSICCSPRCTFLLSTPGACCRVSVGSIMSCSFPMVLWDGLEGGEEVPGYRSCPRSRPASVYMMKFPARKMFALSQSTQRQSLFIVVHFETHTLGSTIVVVQTGAVRLSSKCCVPWAAAALSSPVNCFLSRYSDTACYRIHVKTDDPKLLKLCCEWKLVHP